MHSSVVVLPLVVGAFAVVKVPYGSTEKRVVEANGCHQVAWSSESPRRMRIGIGLSWKRKHFSCSFHSKCTISSWRSWSWIKGVGYGDCREKLITIRNHLVAEVHGAEGYGTGRRNAFAATNKEESRGGTTENSVAVKEEGEKPLTEEDWEKPLQDSDTRLLANFLTPYNFVQVVEVARSADHLLAGARILLLDNPPNIHSLWYEHKVLTNSYYDEFATLMPLLPDGPVGIYGVGAGATAHIIHHFWPTVTMHGWELDPDIITIAREFFNLTQLEVEPEKRLSASEDAVFTGFECNHVEDFPVVNTHEKEDSNISVQPASTNQVAADARTETQSGRMSGKLFVHIGDALASDATVEGGFAGLIVDLFAHGAVIPALLLPETWEQLKNRLHPEGRIMVNCGGSWVEAEEGGSKSIGQSTMEETIAAMVKVFSGQLSRIYLERNGRNTMVLTGPSPDMQAWSDALPKELRALISDWVAVP